MKKIITALAIFASILGFSQVGIGTTTPSSKSILDLTATDKGFLLPRMTTTQRTAISPVAPIDKGMQVFDTTTNTVWFWNGTLWIEQKDTNTTYTGSTSVTLNGSSFERAALSGDVSAVANSNTTTISNNAVTSAKIADGTIVAADINQMAATSGQVLKWNGTAWTPSADTDTTVISSVSNTSSANALSTTVNGTTGSTVNIINSNALASSSNAITSTVNGVTATLTPTAGGTITENLGFNASGALVRQTSNVANTPNIYSANGTIGAGRTVGVTDNVNFDSNTFVIDGTNNRVGIGTNTPTRQLEVVGSAGILSSVKTTGTWAESNVSSTNSNGIVHTGFLQSNSTLVGDERIQIGSRTNTNIAFNTNDTSTRMFINSSTGNVGIGSNNNPAEKLDVFGNVKFSQALMPNGLAGTSGQVLTSAGTNTAPTWTNVSSLPVTNTLTSASNAITSAVNGVSSTLTPTAGGTVTENLGFNASGALVRQTFNVSNTPNIYSADGTLGTNRIVSHGANLLTFAQSGSNNSRSMFNITNPGSNSWGAFLKIRNSGTVNGALISYEKGVKKWAAGLGSNGSTFEINEDAGDAEVGAGSFGSTRFSIVSGGNIGIGTSSPAEKLDVSGNVRFSQALMPNGLAGTSGQVLTSAGANTAPTWTNVSSLPVTNTLTSASNAITSTVNGVTATLTPTAGGTITENLGFNASGALVRQTSNVANTPNIYSANGTIGAGRTVGVTDNVNFDSNTFVIDGTNNRVGVGTATPTEKLDLVGNVKFSQALMPNGQAGTTGQMLTSAGANTAPTWTTLSTTNTPNIYSANGTIGAGRTVGLTDNVNFDSNTFVIDGTNNKVGIGTNAPTTALHVNSPSSPALRLVDGTQGAGKVLSSDANGNASWVTNVSVTPTVLGNNPTLITNYASPGTGKYLGMSVTLPAGKWIINVGLLINNVYALGANTYAVVRHKFSVSNTILDTTGITLLQPGNNGYFLREIITGANNPNFAMMLGSVSIQLAATTTLYFWQDSGGCVAGPSSTFTNLYVTGNGENYIYAIPIN